MGEKPAGVVMETLMTGARHGAVSVSFCCGRKLFAFLNIRK